MVHRVALLVASLAAAITFAAGFVLAGFSPQADPVEAAPVATDVSADPSPPPRVQVDTVYLAPQAPPQDVTVTKVIKSSGRGEDEGEGGDDD